MLLKRTGMPEEGELLLCTVSKIYYNSVFVNLDEFPGKSGLIHISEIAPGRIRNIRDYITEGKKIVCKVLRIDLEKGHIDLSLRRVAEGQRREKIDTLKQEQKAEKIVEHLAKETKQELPKLYAELSEKICAVYPTVFTGFQAVAFGEATLEELGVSKASAKPLTELIMQRIKPPKVTISGTFTVSTYTPNGIAEIRQAFEKGSKKGREQLTISYLGAGRYYLVVTAPDYKAAEALLKEISDAILKELKKSGATASFMRQEK
ncbi:translation initiation factor IF-2 subunit alpha [Candidatus Woesearchaeota archaeon]|nr:translation initiation factor IF-2 subunit alpha [Candidatus Woesearchaeota archaeon]